MTKTRTQTKVKDIMTKSPICVSPTAGVRILGELFDENDISGMPVVDGQNRLLGVVSKTDIIHRCVEGPLGAREGMEFWDQLRVGSGGSPDLDPDDLGRAEDFMTTEPVTAGLGEDVGAVARRMALERVHRAVVVDDGNHPVGILTALDLLGFFPD